MSHANISVFVPHIGCKRRCSFCNQNSITGHFDVPNASTVDKAVSTALKTQNYDSKNTQLAFFGGSFTAIEKDYMLSLLQAGYAHIKKGNISGIRISTRPDAVNQEILDILKQYGVKAIELGAQSLNNDVLKQNFRGHTAEDVVNASALIKANGFELGLQMMTGLMGDTEEFALATAQKIIELNPATVRVYPTVVLKNTYLEKAFYNKLYSPQTVEQAACLAAKIIYLFYKNNINVIRLGLHSIDQSTFVAGPWHPAFGEITQSKIYLSLAENLLKNCNKQAVTLCVKKGEGSKMTGQKKCNILFLQNKYSIKIKVKEQDNLEKYTIITE